MAGPLLQLHQAGVLAELDPVVAAPLERLGAVQGSTATATAQRSDS